MNILIVPDKFKGSLTAREVCSAIEEGILESNSTHQIVSIPLADGGEGTAEILTEVSKGKKISIKVFDPLFREIESSYGISGDGKTAFIEMAAASGLMLLRPSDRNPMHTSTFGTGQLISAALQKGVKHIVLGIGGSATNDAGIGMAAALGFEFVDIHGSRVEPIGKNLAVINSINKSGIDPLLKKVRFTILCDVNNPLHGENGAAHVFGPQKGANTEEVKLLDKGLKHFENMVKIQLNLETNFPGAGAAGGLGAGAKVFLQAEIRSGFDFISAFTHLEDHTRNADIVITGEGKIDRQTRQGKVVDGVTGLAGRLDKKCVVFVGKDEYPKNPKKDHGFTIIPIVQGNIAEAAAMENAYSFLKARVQEYFRANY